VVERGEKRQEEESEGEDDDDYDGVEDEPPAHIPHNPTSVNIGQNNSGSVLENNGNNNGNNSNVVLNNSGVSNGTNVNGNIVLPPLQELQPMAQPEAIQIALVP